MGKSTAKGIESVVEERRLRPIYELLDINCNKRAVQELDRLLKKQPNFTSAKVLKALALLRLGKKTECEDIIAKVVAEDVPPPTDESTIQALSICYRELDKPRAICELLERACKLDKNEDLLTHCFMAHVRIGEFQKQHQIALSLYKLYPKTPYFSWSVMSLYVKAEKELSDPAHSLRLTLPLAERMMEKFINDNKIESDHELHLFMLILRKQGKYEKILELIAKSSERKLGSVTGFVQKIKIESLRQTGKLEILAEYLEGLILESPDEWKYYNEYIKLCIHFETEPKLKRVQSFLENLLASSSSSDQIQKQRPILLACFRYYHLIAEKNISTDWDVLSLFKNYVVHFGHKPTFFTDIGDFVNTLETLATKDILLNSIKASTDLPTPPILRDDIQRELNYTFLELSLLDEPCGDLVRVIDLFEKMVLKYLHSLEMKTGLDDFLIIGAIKLTDTFWSFQSSNSWTGFYQARPHLTNKSDDTSKLICTKERDVIEIIGDNFKSPASVTTFDIDRPFSEISNGLNVTVNDSSSHSSVSEDDFPVLYCAAVLNYGLFESVNNAQMRILLAKLFIRCGAVGAAAETLRGLDLKHMQLESLGYIYIWKLIRCGFARDGQRILHNIEHFFSVNEKDSMEHILSSYKYGSWEKILEFMDFRKLLLRSTQFATAKIEKRLLEYLKNATNRAESVKIAVGLKDELNLDDIFLTHWNELTDNRDLSVLTETGVKRCKGLKEWADLTFAADKKTLKIRGFTLSLVNNCVLLIENSQDEDEMKKILGSIDATRFCLKEELANLDDLQKPDINSITGPWPSRIFEYVSSGYVDLLLKLASLISSLMKEPGSSETLLSEFSLTIRDDLETIVSQRMGSLKKFQKRKSLLEFSEVLESLFELVETLGLMCTLLDVVGFIIQKNANPKSKKKKGKLTSTADTRHLSHFLNLLTATSECLVKFDTEMRNSTQSLVQNFSIKWENIDGFWKGRVEGYIYARVVTYSMPTILFKLSESYYNSLQEISSDIESKTKYLESIRAQFLF